VSEPRPLSTAEIIAVGTELLAADRTDTNSLFITAGLNDLGIEVRAKAVVGDRFDDLAAVCRDAVARADLIVLTGGLGPTDDDLTRGAVAHVLNRRLEEDAPTVERIRARFARRHLPMPEINRRQALVIDGARLLDNALGTAPGQWLEHEGRLLALLPGPPREMRPMFEAFARDVLQAKTSGARLWRRSVRIVGRSESAAEEVLQPLYARWNASAPAIVPTILAASGAIELQLTVRARDEALALIALDGAAGDVAAAFGLDVVSLDGDRLEVVVGALLRRRHLRLALAESCTGGLVTSRLTDVAGSSDYVEMGVVAYSNAAKHALLGVPAALIAEHGAVSEPVAQAMAHGARQRSGADVAVGITGIAGPGGGSEAKPVGTVAIAVDGPGAYQSVRTFLFPGNREMVKTFAATTAIDRVRRALLAAS
jgi:nicotinamide-nucleotide amidase